MNKKQEEVYLRFLRLHEDVVEEHKEQQNEYWQGKKDAFRITMIYIRELLDMDGVRSAELLRNSSPAARSTRLEILESMAKDARFYIGEALWMARDNVPLRPTSRINWKQWISWYEMMEKKGIVPEAEGAID